MPFPVGGPIARLNIDGGMRPMGGPIPRVPFAGTYKKGGKVKKTGMAKVHKGERVLTKAQQKRMVSEPKAGLRKMMMT